MWKDICRRGSSETWQFGVTEVTRLGSTVTGGPFKTERQRDKVTACRRGEREGRRYRPVSRNTERSVPVAEPRLARALLRQPPGPCAPRCPRLWLEGFSYLLSDIPKRKLVPARNHSPVLTPSPFPDNVKSTFGLRGIAGSGLLSPAAFARHPVVENGCV